LVPGKSELTPAEVQEADPVDGAAIANEEHGIALLLQSTIFIFK
jgi:hypothetical protein